MIGHNLDESFEVPGMILGAKRGLAKDNLTMADIDSRSDRVKGLPRVRWVSKYGSLVYSTCGKEFIDGGLNEAGLYVGEMTLLGSQYPDDPGLVKIYHHLWIQYLLDSFASVPEALESLAKVVPDGHCQWHFFLADREGRAAVVEFDEKKTLVYSGTTLPWRILTNFTYPSSLARLAEYEGFGGAKQVETSPDCKPDRRFHHAAAAIRRIEAGPEPLAPGHVFSVLEAMYCGAWNRWSVVLDPKAGRVWWNTNRGRTVRFLDLASVDFSCATPVMAVDIHRERPGDAAAILEPLTDALNEDYLRRYWASVDAGFLGNMFWKRKFPPKMQAYQKSCGCTVEAPAADR